MNQSAGNLKFRRYYNVQPISDHMEKHHRYDSDEAFGHYLAGLIEGDGYFGDRRLEIVLHENDRPLAFWLRSR